MGDLCINREWSLPDDSQLCSSWQVLELDGNQIFLSFLFIGVPIPSVLQELLIPVKDTTPDVYYVTHLERGFITFVE